MDKKNCRLRGETEQHKRNESENASSTSTTVRHCKH